MKRHALAVLLLAAGSGTAFAEKVPVLKGEIVWARLIEPVDRYDHNILGDVPDWGALKITVNTCLGCAGLHLTDVIVTLPQTHVFEDVEARVADLDADGHDEVVVVETDMARGAVLAVYDVSGRRAATDAIGQTHRWLAPAGIGDFDGDGRIEIAYVDRPHLAKELVFLRYDRGTLTEIARSPGLTNHRIGQEKISGGMVVCAGQDTLLVASADWTQRIAVRLEGGKVIRHEVGRLESPDAWIATCP